MIISAIIVDSFLRTCMHLWFQGRGALGHWWKGCNLALCVHCLPPVALWLSDPSSSFRSEFTDSILSVHPSDVLDMPVDPNEPTYCLCHQVSYGEMIGCDNPDVSGS